MQDKLKANVAKHERLEQFNAIVSEYEAALLRYAARLLGNSSAAEDVVQEAFIKLYRRWEGTLEPSAGLSAWLYRVVHNQAVDYIKKESRRSDAHQRHIEEHAVMSAPSRPGANRSADETRLNVRDALEKLPLRERELVVLKIFENKSYKEISEITGLTTGYVGNILHHAMKRLTEILKDTGAL